MEKKQYVSPQLKRLHSEDSLMAAMSGELDGEKTFTDGGEGDGSDQAARQIHNYSVWE